MMIVVYHHVLMLTSLAAAEARSLSRLFKALGDETRVRIVALLAHGELCVCHIEDALGLQQSTTSRQLGVLRAAGLVEARRDGSWVYYRLALQTDALCKRVVRDLARDFAARVTMRRDVERLVRTRGPRSCA
jgi:ArsR family transcriptional regulator